MLVGGQDANNAFLTSSMYSSLTRFREIYSVMLIWNKSPDYWIVLEKYATVTGQILFTTHTADFAVTALFWRRTTNSSGRDCRKLHTPKLTGQVYLC